MKDSFNVLDQAWIPTVTLSGHRQDMGIRETLANAHLLREISDASPLKEYSVYRFLGLFLMDALRPASEIDIEDLLDIGAFDMSKIENYIEQCQGEGVSFDLFDDNIPFLQSKLDEKIDTVEKPVSILDCTLPSGNNHVHFMHKAPEKIEAGEAVRLLLSTYLFCTAGAQGYPSGVYGAPPFFGVIKGKNLYETLINILLPISWIGIPFDEPPVLWRRKTRIKPKGDIPGTSWLQGMLFPTRRIHLIGDGNGYVRAVYLSQGENFINKETWKDPYVTYRNNDTSVFPLRPHADSPIWRNFCDLIDLPGNHASQLLQLYRTIHDGGNVALTLYGVETSQASYLSTQRYDLSFPILLTGQESVELLTRCIAAAQSLQRSLRKALSNINGLPDTQVVSAANEFEKDCESRFWRLCRLLSEGGNESPSLYSDYCDEISDAVMREYTNVCKKIHLRAHSLTMAEENRVVLFREVQKLKKGANL